MSERAERWIRLAMVLFVGLAVLAGAGCGERGSAPDGSVPKARRTPPSADEPDRGGGGRAIDVPTPDPDEPPGPQPVPPGHVTIDTGRSLDHQGSASDVWHLSCDTPGTVAWRLGTVLGGDVVAVSGSCAGSGPVAPASTPPGLLQPGSADDALIATHDGTGVVFQIQFGKPETEDAEIFLGLKHVASGDESTHGLSSPGVPAGSKYASTLQVGPLTLADGHHRVQLTLRPGSGSPAGEIEHGETENYMLSVDNASQIASLQAEGSGGFQYMPLPSGGKTEPARPPSD